MQIVDVQGRICAMPDSADSSQIEAALMKLPVGIYVGVPAAHSNNLPLERVLFISTNKGGISIMTAKSATLFPIQTAHTTPDSSS